MNKPLYLLKGTIYRNDSDLDNLVEIEEIFKHDNLFEARKQVFNKYQSYVDVFLESIDSSYESFEQTVLELERFIKSSRQKFILNEPENGEIEIDFDKGLFIYLVPDSSKISYTKERQIIYEDKILIHSFCDNLGDDMKYVYNGLINEYSFYKSIQIFENFELPKDALVHLRKEFRGVDILISPIDFQKWIDENRMTIDDLMRSLGVY
ncbi:MAG: hypothetical protein AB7S69_11725 [Salinivirgaceae bacterium]